MSEAKPTPGPWEVLPPYAADPDFMPPSTVADRSWRVVHGPTRQPVAYVPTEADAELIVRAVNAHADLLAACKAILAGWGHQDGVSHAIELARAAIAKAEGH